MSGEPIACAVCGASSPSSVSPYIPLCSAECGAEAKRRVMAKVMAKPEALARQARRQLDEMEPEGKEALRRLFVGLTPPQFRGAVDGFFSDGGGPDG